jgi:N-acetylglucosamine-6-phosphate deacetylase
MQTIKGIHYKTGQPIAVEVHNGIIKSIDVLDIETRYLPVIAPGMIDMQVNGYYGIDFNKDTLTVDDVVTITKLQLAQGVTTYFPTVITNSVECIKQSLNIIAQACNEFELVNSCIGGIHLEGPFISPLDGPVGAHNKRYVRAPDWDLFQQFNETAQHRIKIITLSPEWPQAIEFTRQCVKSNIIVSIGHTAASSQQIAAVVDAGATLSTHLGNGTHQTLPRHPNYIWDQLADDRLATGFIGDGFHLPLSVIKVILKVKADKAILVSDSVSLAGMPFGNYNEPVGGDVVLTADGKLHLAGKPDTLAGSAQTQLQALQKLYHQGLCSMAQAWDLASVNAAGFLKYGTINGLQVGAQANLALYYNNHKTLDIATTYKNGVQVYPEKLINTYTS